MFELGPFALRYYGLCIALGIIVATWLTGRELERKGYDGALALDSLFFIVPLALSAPGPITLSPTTGSTRATRSPAYSKSGTGPGDLRRRRRRVCGALDLRPDQGHKPVGVRRRRRARTGPRPGDRALGELLQPGALRSAFGFALGHPDSAGKQASRVLGRRGLSPTFLYESIWDALVCLILLLWPAASRTV